MSHENETSSCFWLPSEFFADDDEKQTPNNNLPKEFPYEWAMSTSPQSTLAHYRSWAGSSNGSPLGVNSPPTTPFGNTNEAVRDLIDKAANQVATLNLTDNFKHGPTKNYLGPHNSQAFQRSGWSVQQDPTRFGVGSGKRKCAGTGVFLPRVNTRGFRNENSDASYFSDSRNKQGYSFGLVPDKNANLGFSQSQPTLQSQFNQAYIQNYETLIARRNSLILQRRALVIAERSLMMNGDKYLPQEWTY